MTKKEWESLCDGCAKCCLEKIEYEDTGKIHYTDIACPLLDREACRCTNYPQRKKIISDCEKLTPTNVLKLGWMPSTCAYRLLMEGKDLYDWHPLISGDPQSVHRAGQSVRGRAVPHEGAGDWENHIVFWPK